MPFAIILAFLYTNLILSSICGFMSLRYSFTLTFFPAFFITLFLAFFHRVVVLQKVFLFSKKEGKYLCLVAILGVLSLLSFTLNIERYNFDMSVRLFNLLIPSSIVLLHFTIWATPHRRNDLSYIFSVIFVFFVIDALVSFLTFIGGNILHIIPINVFYNNDELRVTLFTYGSNVLIRTPGIFPTGGGNASFVLVINSFVLCHLLFNYQSTYAKAILIILLLITLLLISFTISRRGILILFLDYVLAAFLFAFSKNKLGAYLTFLTSAFMLTFAALSVYNLFPLAFTSTSLLKRLHFWKQNVFNILGNDIFGLLFGNAITQSSFDFVSSDHFVLIDNGFLSLIIYGGIPLLLIFILLYIYILFPNIRMFSMPASPHIHWLSAFNIMMIFNMFTLSFFSNLIMSVATSFTYYTLINVITKRLVMNSRQLR